MVFIYYKNIHGDDQTPVSNRGSPVIGEESLMGGRDHIGASIRLGIFFPYQATGWVGFHYCIIDTFVYH